MTDQTSSTGQLRLFPSRLRPSTEQRRRGLAWIRQARAALDLGVAESAARKRVLQD